MATTLVLAENIDHHQNFSHEFRRKVGPFFTIKRPRGQDKDNNNNVIIKQQQQQQQPLYSLTTATKTSNSINNNDNNNNNNNFVRTFKDVPNCCPDLLETTRRHILKEYEQHPECFFEADIEQLLNDDWFLTRFLLRRQKDIKETVKLIKECGLFRHEFNVHPQLTYRDFPLEFFTLAGIFPYEQDRFGNQTLILRASVHNPQMLAKLNLQLELKRFLLYSMEQSDRLNKGRGIAVVFDMSHASLGNLDWELLTWIVSSFRQYCPKVVSYILVYNLPWFLSGPMKLASTTLLTNSNRKRLRFVQGKEIMDYIAKENLPDFLGGSCYVDYQSTSLVECLRSNQVKYRHETSDI